MKLPYDLSCYGHTLRHHGTPTQLSGWEASLIRRAIGDTAYFDGIGPWPYATLPDTIEQIDSLHTAMREQDLVSFSACARPDQSINADIWRNSGFEVIPLKPHFVHHPRLPFPQRSAKTRANLSKARRYWKTELSSPLLPALEEFARWHAVLNQRKDMSLFTRLPPDHFRNLVNLPGCHLMTAHDEDGFAAAVILMVTDHEVHCHAQAGANHAYTRRAFYALYDAILEHWGKSHTIYLGGVPGGADGPGIERFKRRFANGTSDITMVRTILNPQVSTQLAQTRGDPKWFPPYRSRVE